MKLAAVILPSLTAFGTTCVKSSYNANSGMIMNAARSRPRRERSMLARDVVMNRARTTQNRTCSTTATTATITPNPPLARPTVTPSRPMTFASGQKPVNDAASKPAASPRVRSGYSASAEGSSVLSMPKTMTGAVSQPNANTVKMTEVSSTDVLLPRSPASTRKAMIASRTANAELTMKEIFAESDERSALTSRRSFSWTRSRATTAPPRRPHAVPPGR